MAGPKNTLKQKEVVDLSTLTVIEAAELAKMLEEKWGVSTASVAVAAGPASLGDNPLDFDEQTEFDLILISAGKKKVEIIKEVRSITGLGLKEAKDLVDNLPRPIKLGVEKNEAVIIRNQIIQAGGRVDIGNRWASYQTKASENNPKHRIVHAIKSRSNDLTEDEWTEVAISALRTIYSGITPPDEHVNQIKQILGGIK